ncbi:hypothetical protein [Streptomyces sp. NPDC055134]
MLSLHLLQNRVAAVVFDPSRREVRAALARAGLAGTTKALMRLSPWAACFPGFLTPGRGVAGPAAGAERVLSTPRRRLAAELTEVYTRGPVPPGVDPGARPRSPRTSAYGHALGPAAAADRVHP